MAQHHFSLSTGEHKTERKCEFEWNTRNTPRKEEQEGNFRAEHYVLLEMQSKENLEDHRQIQ